VLRCVPFDKVGFGPLEKSEILVKLKGRIPKDSKLHAQRLSLLTKIKLDLGVSFTLTLDLDWRSIGDKEAFKRGVRKDVATAANIDAKHVRGIQVRVTELHADSAIVDMLIAKEAGNAEQIVRNLEDQLKTPKSLLMQGKVTRKAKKGPE
jgi:hypothetical protein